MAINSWTIIGIARKWYRCSACGLALARHFASAKPQAEHRSSFYPQQVFDLVQFSRIAPRGADALQRLLAMMILMALRAVVANAAAARRLGRVALHAVVLVGDQHVGVFPGIVGSTMAALAIDGAMG